MTVTKGLALFVSVTLAGVLVRASGLADGPATVAPRLTAISSRVNSKGASLLIETSVPVPYVATRLDALTVLLDLRNVGSEGVANSVAAAAKSPIAGVRVEDGDSLGAPGSRAAHRARAARRLPRAQRAQHDHHRFRQAVRESGALRPAADDAPDGAGRDAGTRPGAGVRSADHDDPVAALGMRQRSGSRRPPPPSASAPPAPRRAGCSPGAADAAARAGPERAAARRAQVHRPPDHPRLPGRRPAIRAARLRGGERAEHRHRSGRGRHRGRVAARGAVGPGARHHSPRQQAWLHRGRHHRPHRAAVGAGRRGDAEAQAVRRAGARRRAARATRRRSATRRRTS